MTHALTLNDRGAFSISASRGLDPKVKNFVFGTAMAAVAGAAIDPMTIRGLFTGAGVYITSRLVSYGIKVYDADGKSNLAPRGMASLLGMCGATACALGVVYGLNDILNLQKYVQGQAAARGVYQVLHGKPVDVETQNVAWGPFGLPLIPTGHQVTVTVKKIKIDGNCEALSASSEITSPSREPIRELIDLPNDHEGCPTLRMGS